MTGAGADSGQQFLEALPKRATLKRKLRHFCQHCSPQATQEARIRWFSNSCLATKAEHRNKPEPSTLARGKCGR